MCVRVQGTPPIDEGSVVCKSDRKALGRIDEVFGPVPRPLYTVRTSSAVELPCFARCRDARTHARVVCR